MEKGNRADVCDGRHWDFEVVGKAGTVFRCRRAGASPVLFLLA